MQLISCAFLCKRFIFPIHIIADPLATPPTVVTKLLYVRSCCTIRLRCEDQCFSEGKETQWRNLDSLCELYYPSPQHYFMTGTGVNMFVCTHMCISGCVYFMSSKTTSEETSGPLNGLLYSSSRPSYMEKLLHVSFLQSEALKW